MDFRFRFVQDFKGLFKVGFAVCLDFFGRQDGAQGRSAARVAYACGVVAYYKDRLVAQVLKLPHLIKYNHVAECEVGAGRIYAQFDSQFFAFGKFLFQIVGADKRIGVLSKYFELIFHIKKFPSILSFAKIKWQHFCCRRLTQIKSKKSGFTSKNCDNRRQVGRL